MIKKIIEQNEIFSFKKRDIYSLRIISLLKAYGTSYDFASFYCCFDSQENIVAIISQLDSDFTVSHTEINKDIEEEISVFIQTCGYSSVLTDNDISLFGEKNYEYGIVMESTKKSEFNLANVVIDEYPKLMDIFNLENYDKWSFESWYVDLSHRIRHGTAKAYALRVNNDIVSSALFSSIYEDNAILSSVLTEPEYRGNGYATSLVSHMSCDIKGKIYLMREQDKNERFYQKLGFKNSGIWRMYKK